MATFKNTIKLKKYQDIIEEYVASEAITPGHLLELTNEGKVKKHATAGVNALTMFALEDELQGRGIEDDYSLGDPVQVWVAQRGEIVYAILADDETVVEGDFLESAGGGLLRKHVDESSGTASHSIVGQVVEARDLTTFSAGDTGDPAYSHYIAVRIV